MKKFLGIVALVLVATLALVGCNPSEKYADKINDAADEEKYMTYTQVEKYLGEPVSSIGGSLGGVIKTGKICTWYKGYDSVEEAQEAYDEGKTVYYITVTFDTDDNATSATWTEWVKEDK